jgi:undecaprenyl-diphosphatase
MEKMDFWEHIFLGFLQGITEFLPISSSGHLFLAEIFFSTEPNLNLEISLHGAGLLAIFIFFRETLWKILKGMGCTLGMGEGEKKAGILGWKLIATTLITLPVALILKTYFDVLLTLPVVALTLIITGIFILISERFRPQKITQFSWSIVFFLGFMQGFAVLPGISRSGLTISLLILLGLRRKQSTEISFLLAIPTIFAAVIFSWWDMNFQISFNGTFLIGCLASFFASLIAIRWMMKLIQKHWIWFAPYCIFLGIGLLIFV